jgi:hypothetical protein
MASLARKSQSQNIYISGYIFQVPAALHMKLAGDRKNWEGIGVRADLIAPAFGQHHTEIRSDSSSFNWSQLDYRIGKKKSPAESAAGQFVVPLFLFFPPAAGEGHWLHLKPLMIEKFFLHPMFKCCHLEHQPRIGACTPLALHKGEWIKIDILSALPAGVRRCVCPEFRCFFLVVFWLARQLF